MRTMSLSRRLRVAAAGAALAAFTSSAVAIAQTGPASSTLVSATFSADTSISSYTQTCTASDGNALTITEATYSGTASSSTAMLDGPLTISVRSVYDGTTSAGVVSGSLTIGSSPSSSSFFGTLRGVDANGSLQGILAGSGSGTQLLGNFSVSYSGSGFGSSASPGTIGTGAGSDTAIALGPGCAPSMPPAPVITTPQLPPFPIFTSQHDDKYPYGSSSDRSSAAYSKAQRHHAQDRELFKQRGRSFGRGLQ